MSNDKDNVLAVLHAQADAIAGQNAEAAVAPMAPNIVSYDLPPPLEYRGAGEKSVEGLNAWFATWEDGVIVEMKDPQILVDRDPAVAFGLSRMRGVNKVTDRSTNGVAARWCCGAWTRHGESFTSMARFRR